MRNELRFSRRDAVRASGIGAALLTSGGAMHQAKAQATTPTTGQATIQPRPLLSDNPIWDEFGNRALPYVRDGGADFGECLVTMQRFGDGTGDDWHREWTATADRVAAIGDDCAAAGYRVSAREAYFRATNYYLTSYLPLYGTPVDPRLVAAFEAASTTFLKGAKLLDFPLEAVEIPFAETTLPGYLVTVDDSGAPRPTVVQTNGYDSTIMEMYFAHVPAAIRRGYNVLLFDGPGQGRNLIIDGMHLRPDWENVVRPVIDYALTRPEIDPTRIALSGWSLGGLLAPRAAAFEHRIAALIADPGQWDMRDALVPMLPLTDAQKAAFPDIDRHLLDPMAAWINGPEAPPKLHWSFVQRGFWVNGVDNLFDLLVELTRYEVSSVATNIACPTFISHPEDDSVAVGAPTLYEAITQPKVLMPFTRDEGAGMHCEMMARSLYHQRMYDWLDATLGLDRET